jgi:cytochrome-b5 reductase
MAVDFTLAGLQTAFAQSPFAISTTVIVVAVTIAIILLYTEKPKTFLNPNEFKPLTLTRIIDITHNTKKFVFSLPEAKMRIGLPTGQHITFLAKDEDGKDVYRPYTPVTDDDLPGAVEFVIKLYPNGKMSQMLSKMKVGDSMLMKGPRGRFQYTRNMKKAIGKPFGSLRPGHAGQQCIRVSAATSCS